MIQANPRRGIICCVAANALWAVAAIYLKLVDTASVVEVFCHRIVWAFPTLLLYLLVTSQLHVLYHSLCNWKLVLRYAGSSLLLGASLYVTVWAIYSNHIVEMSLAFFINPLVNVLLGILFLGERLRRYQWVAVTCAVAGVLVVGITNGQVPWIALGIAFNFSIYGFVKKLAPLDPVVGVTIELALISVPAAVYLASSQTVFGHDKVTTDLLLVGAGIFPTAIPYVLYSAAAQHISMTLLGVLQYILPTGSFLVGTFMYHESVSTGKLIGFIVVWAGLLIFTIEGIVWQRLKAPLADLSSVVVVPIELDDDKLDTTLPSQDHWQNLESPQGKTDGSMSKESTSRN
ncbi:Aste57867_14081 [Aphanomyces stellatus]|uniref:Aste57867_14081 protein n=1 Tax=Aphanomyces stellatus TaxID=120398 RepID=A0A485L0N9_9STRA|nr:hypothetical protein As57867_014030 [Aphanomyces stellatus]VFT90909.1 Aste57867_14081 [Aphanomyces stellatus]